MDLDLERELARVLHSRDTAALTDDPVAAVHAGMRRRRRTQRVTVLATAVAVVGVVSSVTWALSGQSGTGSNPAPILSNAPSVQPSAGAASPAPSAATGTAVPAGFTASDLTFTTLNDGFAIGTAPCGAAGTCVTLLRTTDGAKTWTRVPTTGLPHGCDQVGCPMNVRFADPQTGYVFGPTLFMTSDGGATWVQQPGPSTYGLEIAGGTAVRVDTRTPACPGCQFEVQRSTVGSTTWHTVTTSSESRTSASLTRHGDQVVVTLYANPAGGAGDATATLLLSKDGGTTWTTRTDPCGPAGNNNPAEVDTNQVQFSPSGQLVVLCQRRGFTGVGGDTTVLLSQDGGTTFSAATGFPQYVDATLVAGAGQDVLLAETFKKGSADVVLRRSTDGGQSWSAVATVPSGNTPGSFLAFSTTHTGTWVSPARTAVWRTSDGGATWTEHPFR